MRAATTDSPAGARQNNWLLLFFVLAGLTGCSPFTGRDQVAPSSPATFPLQQGTSAGQTFVSHHAGLTGIEFFLTPDLPGDGEIRLHLRSAVDSADDLAVSSLPVAAVTAPGFYRFVFAPQADSHHRDYYALLELRGAGRTGVGSAPGEAYLDGALYHNGEPLDAQAAFRQLFDPWEMLLGFGRQTVRWARFLIVAAFLFLLPGWALLDLLWHAPGGVSWAERAGLASGLSLALYPLLFLWTDLAGLHFGALYAWLPGAIAGGVLLWRHRRWRPGAPSAWGRGWVCSTALWHALALLVVAGLVILVRFLALGSVDVPMWGDSYQHTLMAQLLVDHGGLFDSWEPYAEMETFTYHFGFHAAAAVFHWISGLPLPAATLWTGQILNVLAVISLYPLATRVSGSRWAGVAALVLAGLVAPMPMSYVNWGRYTQLAGQVILPAAVCVVWSILDERPARWPLLSLGWIALAGLALTHYRVLAFALCFVLAFWLLEAWRGRLRPLLASTVLLGAGAALLFSPWLLNVAGGKLVSLLVYRVTTPLGATTTATRAYNAIGDLSGYLPILLWILLPVAAGWGLWRRARGVALFSLWWFLILLAANPQWLHLPGEGALTNFAVFIAAYIPAAILIGSAGGWIAGSGSAALSPRVALVCFFLVTGIGLWGALQRLGDVRVAEHALVTRPDLRAAAWIREKTPPDARFLVNSFFAYGDTVIVGSDGGWWLPLLAGRRTTLPPLTYSSERGPRPDYQQWINWLTREIEAEGIDDPEVLNLFRERGVTHVYIGQRQGRVNYSGPAVLPLEELLASPHYRPIYHEDRVWVFEIVQ